MYILVNTLNNECIDWRPKTEEPFIVGENQIQVCDNFNFDPSISNAVWRYLGDHKFEFRHYRDNREFAEFEYTYEDFISLKNSKSINNAELNYKELPYNECTKYKVWFVENSKEFFCVINSIDNPDNITAFEADYKNTCNGSVGRDEFTGILKVKPRPVEARFFQNHVYFKTGVDSIDSGDCTFWSIDASTAGTTIVTFLPEFSYYLEGGNLHALLNSFTENFKLKMVLAPDIPMEYGGSHQFIGNKKICNIEDYNNVEVLAPPAYIKYYDGMPELNKLQVIITHDVNDNAEIEIALRLYK